MTRKIEFGKNKVVDDRNNHGIIDYVFYLYLLEHAD